MGGEGRVDVTIMDIFPWGYYIVEKDTDFSKLSSEIKIKKGRINKELKMVDQYRFLHLDLPSEFHKLHFNCFRSKQYWTWSCGHAFWRSEDITINSIMTVILNYSVYVVTWIMKHMFPYSGSKSRYIRINSLQRKINTYKP